MKKSSLNPIGYYSVCNSLGVYVYDIQYGIDDYIISGWSDNTNIRKRKIYTNREGRSYFNMNGRKIFLDEVCRL